MRGRDKLREEIPSRTGKAAERENFQGEKSPGGERSAWEGFILRDLREDSFAILGSSLRLAGPI